MAKMVLPPEDEGTLSQIPSRSEHSSLKYSSQPTKTESFLTSSKEFECSCYNFYIDSFLFLNKNARKGLIAIKLRG